MTTQEQKAERFRALHADVPFILPNPYDAGSARVLQALGFQALATTSSGFAFTIGKRDGAATLDEVAAHVEVARKLPFPFMLTARAENQSRGNRDLDATIRRLQAYEAVGADVLFAPGLSTVDEIRTVCQSVTKPVNVLTRPTFSFADIAEAGAQRVSVGGALTWVAGKAMVDAAIAMRDHGDFSALAARIPPDLL